MDSNAPPSGDPGPRKASLFSRERARKPASEPPPERKLKRRRSGFSQISVVFSLLLVGIAAGAAGFVMLLSAEGRVGPLAEEKTLVLTREDDDGPIAEQLEKAGVIDNATLFSIMTAIDGKRGALKRGEYKFAAGVSMREVEDMLEHHRVLKHKLPIPEGLTSEQIVDRLRESDLLTGEVKEIPREGSLLPDTYVFERGDSRSVLLAHMGAEMTKVANAVWAKRGPDLPIKSPGELVTLASIVEKETGKADERPKVASVFVNRLEKHMKLQSDPTIVYGLVFGKGSLGHPITKAELQEATPYNTYFIDGLPPGPICNPGRAALEAVANPAKGHDLFFVADGTGGHAFAETLDQHQKNVAHWRQIEKDAKESKDRLSPDVSPPPNVRGEAPDMDASRYGALEGVEGGGGVSFGLTYMTTEAAPAPAPVAGPKSEAAASAMAARLARAAEAKRRMAALTGAGGALSAEKLANGALDSVVVTGVNDPSPGSEDAGPIPLDGPVATAPMAPAALADLRAREARYGSGATAVAAPAPAPETVAASVGPTGTARGFDASEGTKLDPLRNKTYDLQFAKDVPANLR